MQNRDLYWKISTLYWLNKIVFCKNSLRGWFLSFFLWKIACCQIWKCLANWKIKYFKTWKHYWYFKICTLSKVNKATRKLWLCSLLPVRRRVQINAINPHLKIVCNASLINGLQLFLSKLSRVVFVSNLQPVGQEFKYG